jgi:hypothetical protein
MDVIILLLLVLLAFGVPGAIMKLRYEHDLKKEKEQNQAQPSPV